MPKTGREKLYSKVVDYKVTFESEHGKRVLLDLMRRHHMMGAFRGDPTELQFREGERFVILTIMKMMKMNLSRLKESIDKAQEEINNE